MGRDLTEDAFDQNWLSNVDNYEVFDVVTDGHMDTIFRTREDVNKGHLDLGWDGMDAQSDSFERAANTIRYEAGARASR